MQPDHITGNHPLRQGFTLIEMLMAVTLGIIVALVAVVVFRAATDAMAGLDRMARENALIRAGYFAVCDDADFWNSHANPSYPYLRAHASEDPGTGSFWDSRPFKKVDWPASLDDPANPNWRQPHEPGCWYRGWLTPNVQSGCYRLVDVSGNRDPVDVRLRFDPAFRMYHGIWATANTFSYHPDLGRNEPKNFFDTEGGKEMNCYHKKDFWSNHLEFPPGWEWWHVAGDYAALGNVCGWACDTDGDGAFSEAERSLDGYTRRHDHSQGMMFAQEQLGMWGVDTYLQTGTLNQLCASSVNLTHANIGVKDKLVRRGEIPWQYQAGGDALSTGVMSPPAGFTAPPRRGGGGPAYDVANFGKGAWFASMPDYFDVLRAAWKIGPVLPVTGDLACCDADGPFVTARFLKAHGDSPFSAGGSLFVLENHVRRNSKFLATQTMILPPGPLPENLGDSWKERRYQLDLTRPYQGILPALGMNLIASGDHGSHEAGVELRFAPVDIEERLDVSNYAEARSRETAWTWRVPVSYTGDPDPDLSEEGTDLRLKTGIFRERFQGVDRAECQVVVSDKEGATAYRMRFNVIGTSLRGARQYYGRQSAAGTPGIAVFPVAGSARVELGDHYVP